MLNTLERLIRKDEEYDRNESNAPNITRILKGMLEYTECEDIQDAFKYGGRLVWAKMAGKISTLNKHIGNCMFAMARFHKKLEKRGTTWFTAPLWGHSNNNPITPLTKVDVEALRTAGIYNIG
jgi:hypothetical protein